MLVLVAVCLGATALFAIFTETVLRLPLEIGVMLGALLLTSAVIALAHLGVTSPEEFEASLVGSIDFSALVLDAMLAVLLFGGGLEIKADRLRANIVPIASAATLGTALTAGLVAALLWALEPLTGIALPFAWWLVFGALIAPTDPVAVAGVLETSGMPPRVSSIIAGESMFNDGIGVVVFSVALALATTPDGMTVPGALVLFLREGGGGVALGAAAGIGALALLHLARSYEVRVLVTIATVACGYAASDTLDVSGPLSMVVAGLVVGLGFKRWRQATPSEEARREESHMVHFWILICALLDLVLFVLLGLEVVSVPFGATHLAAGAAAIAVALGARAACVGLPIRLTRKRLDLPPGSWRVITWAGLRGGVSLALVLSIDAGPQRDALVPLAYVVIVFSILVQGLTLKRLSTAVFGQESGNGTDES